MPRQNERIANSALGSLLSRLLIDYTVTVESSRTLVEGAGKQPDILLTGHGRAPVVIEAEFMPAYTAERDAQDRLGRRTVEGSRIIEAAIALRYPAGLESATDLLEELSSAQLQYAVFYEGGDRFPISGWLSGSQVELAELTRLVSVPQRAANAASKALERGINSGAEVLKELSDTRPGIASDIVGKLSMPDLPQTRRMACAIIANAMVFHDRIAGMHVGIKPLDVVCGDKVPNPKSALVEAWDHILTINYWPIFAIARDIVLQLPTQEGVELLLRLRNATGEVAASGASFAHDLTGQIFQRLITDREYLATYYTLPASAALLARLAVTKLDYVDWADATAVGRLRVGDFACGTGALLAAVYEQFSARHAYAGGEPSALHPLMMEEVLYGCDVMPSAVHVTGSTLSRMQPMVGFGKTRLYTLAYGRQEDGTTRIGSLELLESSATMTLFNTSDPALRTGSAGEETASQVIAEVPDEGFDIVIMNPPFTRAGSDWEGEGRKEDAIKQFRGLDTDLETQKEMSKREKQFTKNTCYHGYAGIASAFAALGDRKLKPGGVLALVLPLSTASGVSWQGFRELLTRDYVDISVLSIAANGRGMAFSSDTGMGECLVVARKSGFAGGETSAKRVHFTSLNRRPPGFAHAAEMANEFAKDRSVRAIEDGPYAGTPLNIGDEQVGEMLSVPIAIDGEPWGAVRLADASLAQTAYALSRSRLWLPGLATSTSLKIAPLGEVGERGLYHRNIAGSSGAPFTKAAARPTATFPALWNHYASRETRILCEPDIELRVRNGMETKAAAVWAKASHVHLNIDYTFGSQPLAVAFTDRKSLGGPVWTNVILDDSRFDFAYAVWGNSTLGLLMYWWHSSRQQSSKARLTVSTVETLPILDLRGLSDKQLVTAESIFDDFRDRELKPAFQADVDPNRELLDRRVVCELLGFEKKIFEAVRLLAAKWCAEPSVHGGKQRA